MNPMRTLLLPAVLGLSALAAGCVVAPPYGYYSDEAVATAPPPAPQRGEPVGTPQVAGHVWIDGYWDWGGGSYLWVPGYWTAPRVGFYWVPRTWMLSGRVWVRGGGHWRRR